jgi:two-component system alkaline phosphatase synthesis response regulator PhoP
MVMLDIMLPKEDGISILKKLRSNTKTASLPVMMVTAKGTEYDKVMGLDNGADDYITKPFSMIELVARVRALMRRSEQKERKEELRYSNVALNVKKHTVTVNGQPAVLT